MTNPELVVLGNLLVDDLVYDDGRVELGQAGGATLYLALAARLHSVKVGLVSVCGEDYPRATLAALSDRGVDLSGVRHLDGPGMRTWLLHEGGIRQIAPRLLGPTHAEVSPKPDDIPTSWFESARAAHLAPMPWKTQSDLIAAIGSQSTAQISLDPFEPIRDGTSLQAWRELLADVDIFFLGEDEMLRSDDPNELLATFLGPKLRRIIFKHGARGGHLIDDGTGFDWAAYPCEVVDPTGAGDAFAAGFLAGSIHAEPMPRCLERGIVSASFALEGHGADGLLAATPERAEERLEKWFERD